MPPVPADPRDVEIQRLRAALAEALAGLMATRAELVALREQAKVSEERIAELTAQVDRLTEVVAAGNDRIAELAAAANRKRKAAATPAPKSPPTSATVAPEDRPRPPIIPPKVKPAKKPRRPTGRKPLPDHLEVDESRVLPPLLRALQQR